MYEITGGLSWKSITFYGLALVVLGGTCAMFLRLDPRRRGPEMLGLVTLLLLLVLPVYPWASQPRVERHETVFSGGHAIPRVILITIDTLRRDVLTTYTPESTLSPQIDSLARDGIVFEQAHSAAPWTPPSVASILTGLTPFVHGVSKTQTRIPAGIETLADYFLDAGYATAAFGGNALLYDQPALRRGFQQYEFSMGSPGDSLGLACWRAVFGRGSRPGEQAAGNVTALAESWVRANQERDFLLWLHLMDPHAPYAPPPEFFTDPSLSAHAELGYEFDRFKIRSGEVRYSERRQGWVKELYRSEVRFADDRIGRLMAALKDLGLYDDSLIVLTSDHGEEFWDHGGVDHGHSFYNELVSVPLIIKLPRLHDACSDPGRSGRLERRHRADFARTVRHRKQWRAGFQPGRSRLSGRRAPNRPTTARPSSPSPSTSAIGKRWSIRAGNTYGFSTGRTRNSTTRWPIRPRR